MAVEHISYAEFIKNIENASNAIRNDEYQFAKDEYNDEYDHKIKTTVF